MNRLTVWQTKKKLRINLSWQVFTVGSFQFRQSSGQSISIFTGKKSPDPEQEPGLRFSILASAGATSGCLTVPVL
jgi:hypothetical protein